MRVVAPILKYAVYIHYLKPGQPFYVGCGKDYEWRRYSKRPIPWQEALGDRNFSAQIVVHDLDKDVAKRVVDAIVYYLHQRNQGNFLINKKVMPKTSIVIGTISKFMYLQNIFRRRFTRSNVYMAIDRNKRNFHKDYLSSKTV
ncbi:MAG: hypothetical protein COA82_03475 [Alkaliphilus sp.]|nr:MAG: hypothetical protein COA82_03475 [Alkaliphilus sp.]